MQHGPGALYDITRFGAESRSGRLATRAIQAAIDACGAAGGGTVLVPAGLYATGALFLRSHVHLHLAAGSVLLASQRPEDFPPIDGRWEGIEQKTHASLLTGIGLEGISITGCGLLDGRGMPWWAAADETRRIRILKNLAREDPTPPEAPLRWPRPRVVNLVRCRSARMSEFYIRDSPSWNIHLLYCQDVAVDGVSITGMQAGDCCGIVADSCQRVQIVNCMVAAGADCIAVKAGYNEDGRRVGIPSRDITITNCNLTFANGSGLAIGSETAGGISNVTVSNCTIVNCKLGVTIRSTRGRGGVVERIRATDLIVDRVLQSAVLITTFFDSVRFGVVNRGEPPLRPNRETDRRLVAPVDAGTPTLRDIEVAHLTAGDVPNLATIEGLPERFIRGLRLTDLRASRVKSGVLVARAEEVRIDGLAIEPTEQPAVIATQVRRLEVQRLRCPHVPAQVPLIHIEETVGAYVHGCDLAPGDGDFIHLEGPGNRDIVARDNIAITSVP